MGEPGSEFSRPQILERLFSHKHNISLLSEYHKGILQYGGLVDTGLNPGLIISYMIRNEDKCTVSMCKP